MHVVIEKSPSVQKAQEMRANDIVIVQCVEKVKNYAMSESER